MARWFGRRRTGDGALADEPEPSAPGPAAPPITAADLAPRRLAASRPGAWEHVHPLTPATTTSTAPVVGATASFLEGVAGARPLVEPASLRAISSDAPRGVTVGLASPVVPESPAPAAAPVGAAADPGSALPDIEPSRRPVVGDGRPGGAELTAYPGELVYVEPDAEPVFDDDVPEELPPPIFSSLLAERTGRDLGEIRPDLAGALPIATTDEFDEDEYGPAARHRKRSLAESRRLGLGAPLPSSLPIDTDAREAIEPLVVSVPPVALAATPVIAAPPATEAEPPSDPGRRPTVRYRRTEAAPASVRAQVQRALRRDPGDLAVRREAETSDVAARIGARAFTRAGEVFVPLEAGPLDTPETRAVLAHELTHVVQQRVYGAALPGPSSSEGRRLEAEARAVERYVRGDDPTPRVAPVRTLGLGRDGPHVDSGGFVRAVTEQLGARGPAGGAGRPGSADVWRAPTDDTAADQEFRQAAQEDLDAYERWRIGHDNFTDPADRERLDREELERHGQFMIRYGDRLRAALGATGGTGSGGPGPAGAGAAPPPVSVAADEALFGRFREAEGQDFGIGGLVGQFGRRTETERAAIATRISAYDRDYGPRRPGESDEDYRSRTERLHQQLHAAGVLTTPAGATAPTTPTAPAGTPPTIAPPTTAPAITATPALAGGVRPGPGVSPPSGPGFVSVAADEALFGRFREAEGQDFGIGALFGQFGRRSDTEQAAIQTRMTEYDNDYGPRRPGETDDAYAARVERLQANLVAAGVVVTPAGGTAPAGPTTTTAAPGAPAAPATAAPTAAVPATVGPASAGPATATPAGAVRAGPVPATAEHAPPPESPAAARARERAVGGADPTDVLAQLDEADIEQLATLLYGRLSTRLRRELLVDRERTGLLTDFR